MQFAAHLLPGVWPCCCRRQIYKGQDKPWCLQRCCMLAQSIVLTPSARDVTWGMLCMKPQDSQRMHPLRWHSAAAGRWAYLEVAVITKCKSGRAVCSAFTMASLPTPLGPLMTNLTGSTLGICMQTPGSYTKSMSLHQTDTLEQEQVCHIIASQLWLG